MYELTHQLASTRDELALARTEMNRLKKERDHFQDVYWEQIYPCPGP